jgi:hypothetical protein
MRRIIKIGDLITIHKYNHGRSVYDWCKIKKIKIDGKEYGEYEIITEEGDKNTKKVNIEAFKIGKSKGNYWSSDSDKIDECVKEIVLIDNAHEIHYPIKSRLVNGISTLEYNLKWIQNNDSIESKIDQLKI